MKMVICLGRHRHDMESFHGRLYKLDGLGPPCTFQCTSTSLVVRRGVEVIFKVRFVLRKFVQRI